LDKIVLLTNQVVLGGIFLLYIHRKMYDFLKMGHLTAVVEIGIHEISLSLMLKKLKIYLYIYI